MECEQARSPGEQVFCILSPSLQCHSEAGFGQRPCQEQDPSELCSTFTGDLVQELVRQGLVRADELERAIVTEFNPVRISFKDRQDIWVKDVLNTGVSPRQDAPHNPV